MEQTATLLSVGTSRLDTDTARPQRLNLMLVTL